MHMPPIWTIIRQMKGLCPGNISLAPQDDLVISRECVLIKTDPTNRKMSGKKHVFCNTF